MLTPLFVVANFFEICFNFKKGVRALFCHCRIALLIADISLHRFFFLVVRVILIGSIGHAATRTAFYADRD